MTLENGYSKFNKLRNELEEYVLQEDSNIIPRESLQNLIVETHSKYSALRNDLLLRIKKTKDPITQLGDPLTEVTRKERKLLLSLSLLVLLIIEVGLFPTKIAAFGVEFKAENIESLFGLIGLVIIYLSIVFFIYSTIDVRKWRIESIQAGEHNLDDNYIHLKDAKTIQSILDALNSLERTSRVIMHNERENSRHTLYSYFRIFIDFVFPIIFAIYVLYQALTFNELSFANCHIQSSEQSCVDNKGR